jgi:hypothetical protein
MGNEKKNKSKKRETEREKFSEKKGFFFKVSLILVKRLTNHNRAKNKHDLGWAAGKRRRRLVNLKSYNK